MQVFLSGTSFDGFSGCHVAAKSENSDLEISLHLKSLQIENLQKWFKKKKERKKQKKKKKKKAFCVEMEGWLANGHEIISVNFLYEVTWITCRWVDADTQPILCVNVALDTVNFTCLNPPRKKKCFVL